MGNEETRAEFDVINRERCRNCLMPRLLCIDLGESFCCDACDHDRPAPVPPPGPYSIGSDVWPGLAKVVEEAGEVQQAAMKVVALHGAENYDHWDGTDVEQRLAEELADLQAAIRFLIAHHRFDTQAIRDRAERKFEQFQQWHAEATR